MRLFFAVAFPTEVRERLAGVAEALEKKAPGAPVTWVPAANHHLTLRFLGDVADEKVPELVEAVRADTRALGRFQLVLEKVGTFGGRTPRVLWVGVREDAGLEALRRVHHALETRVVALGFEPGDYPVYSPHATLGRVRDERRRPPRARAKAKGKPASSGAGDLSALVAAVATAKLDPIEVAVPRFVLYESQLHGSRHPEYVEAASFDLA